MSSIDTTDLDARYLFASELRLIANADIRSLVQDILMDLPVRTWILPSSSSGKYHNQDERGEMGNLIHTRKVVVICTVLADMDNLPQLDKDLLYAAAILHDSCKYGVKADESHTVSAHPALAARFIISMASGDMDENAKTIANAVASHMGRWTEPGFCWYESKLGRLLHIADMIASRDFISIKL